MKIRTFLFLTTVVTGASYAQIPAEVSNFNQWAVTSGTINYNCPTGWSCSVVSQDNGFLQLQMNQAGSQTGYLRTIVVEPGSTFNPSTDPVPFADETVVQLGLNNSGTNSVGILGKQTINDAGQNFMATSTIASGWGTSVTGGTHLQIEQTIDIPGGAGYADDFYSNFTMSETMTGRSMDIYGIVGLNEMNGQSSDVQVFTLRERSGSFTTPSSVTLPDGTTITSSAGDTVAATWVGQRVATNNMMGGTVDFGFQMFSNETTGVMAEYFNTYSAGPWAWDTVYGANPCLDSTAGGPSATGVDANGNDICP